MRNSIVAMAFFLVSLVLQFFSRRVFLENLGRDILGLNSTVTNLLQFLNLAELGISTAVGFTLYKPIYEKDYHTVNEIVALQGYLYRRIAMGIIVGAAIMMCFFPLIFNKITLPLWYAYASFVVFLFSSLLGYFYNYRQIVLSANQEDYKIQYSYRLIMLLKVVAEIIAVSCLNNGYIYWLCLEFVFAIMASVVLNYTTIRSAPYLRKTSLSFAELNKKYPAISLKVKQLFFHRIGSFALMQTVPLIIYLYISLSAVSMYENYQMLIMGVTSLLIAIFNSIGAGVGNLVAEGDKTRILAVFGELFSFRFFLVLYAGFIIYILVTSFISLWIGPEYILSRTTLVLMLSIMFINLTRYSVDAFINAYGLFQDIWAPVVEILLNVSLALLFGYYYGLNGILVGTLLSLIVVILIWKPIFLFKKGFHENIGIYVKIYFKNLLFGFIGVVFSAYIIRCFHSANSVISWFHLSKQFVIDSLVFVSICASALCLGKCGIEQTFKRIYNLIK